MVVNIQYCYYYDATGLLATVRTVNCDIIVLYEVYGRPVFVDLCIVVDRSM